MKHSQPSLFRFPEGAEKYGSFRDSVLNRVTRVGEPGESPISEMELQAMWFGGEFGRSFVGTGGESIEIVQFGHWNRGAGPDFTEVALRIDGELRSGTLEIDLDSASWEEHGHGANESFDDVVLHIFMHQTARGHFFTRNSRHRSIPQMQLDSSLLSITTARDLPEAFPGRCLAPLQRMPEEAVQSLLESAAQFRVRKKFDRLEAMADATSSRQTMFQAICEALGFRYNKTAMAVLAQRNQLRELLDCSRLEREARIFGAAGFMTSELYDPSLSSDASEYLKTLWHHWWKIRPEVEPEASRAIRWKLSGTRPVNHPQRRIGAIAAVLEHWNSFAVTWEKPGKDLPGNWQRHCDELSHDYWEHYYTLNSKPAKSPMKLIGTDRQRDILGNVLFPWCLGRDNGFWDDFCAMRGVASNEKLRRARLRLFGENTEAAKRFSRFYYQQQALLQIFQDFCLADLSECHDCPFPEQLEQWK